ncbi:nucleoside-diphosphate sugar epimerase [bacterium]|nr:nucleoside-diphosphate sugar epimerase [bacterium]
MKILVTGGAGFIGSHLVEFLLKHGDEVIVLDDLSTGRLENLADVAEHPALQVTEGNVTDEKLVDELVPNVDVVYHLAASVGVKNIVDNLVESIENNVRGTEVILRAASDNMKRILLTSTSEVYGRTNDEPFREDDDLRIGPTRKTRWSYACSKALDEYLGFAYYHERQLPVTAVRLFNTVGERQTDQYGMVLPTFVRQAVANEPITIYGDGSQSRCFCHVSDVVTAIHGLMSSPETAGEVYNIGSTEELSMNDLAERVRTVLGSTSEITYVPYAEAYKVGFDDISRRVPDISKLLSTMAWKPTIGLDEIITRVAAAQQEQRVAENA